MHVREGGGGKEGKKKIGGGGGGRTHCVRMRVIIANLTLDKSGRVLKTSYM